MTGDLHAKKRPTENKKGFLNIPPPPSVEESGKKANDDTVLGLSFRIKDNLCQLAGIVLGTFIGIGIRTLVKTEPLVVGQSLGGLLGFLFGFAASGTILRLIRFPLIDNLCMLAGVILGPLVGIGIGTLYRTMPVSRGQILGGLFGILLGFLVSWIVVQSIRHKRNAQP